MLVVDSLLVRGLHYWFNMIVAVPIWQGRVSPVFDVAEQLVLVELEGPRELGRREVALPEQRLDVRARRLAELGVNTLICGAISRPLQALIEAQQIAVIPRVCGEVDEVLAAYGEGRLDERFAMPGCCRRMRRRCGRRWRTQDKGSW